MSLPSFLFLAGLLLFSLVVGGEVIWRRSVWRKAAKKAGLRFDREPFSRTAPGKISGRYQGFEVAIAPLNKSYRRHWDYQTRLTVIVRRRSAIYLYLRGQGRAFPKMPDLDRTKGLVGHSFSRDFWVRSHPAGFAIDLLSAEVQERLRHDLACGLVVYNDDELAITWSSFYSRDQALLRYLDLAVYLAAQIKQLRGYF